MKKRDFRLDFEWEWRELGLGCIIYKPLFRPFPRKCFWIGLSFRILWFGIFFKLFERKLVSVDPVIYDEKQRMKEISAFHNKELISFQNHGSIDVYWQWNHFGTMIYYMSPKGISMPVCISIDILWFTVSFDFSPKPLLT